jgi:hypothetical protein
MAYAMAEDHSNYFGQLLKRKEDAVRVRFLEVESEGWRPCANDCHNNVDEWTVRRPKSRAVRGWLFWEPDETGRYTFMAHSVVEESGRLMDITPIDANTPREGLWFLPHSGNEVEFQAMKTACSCVVYPPITTDEWRACQTVPIDEPPDL